MGAWSCEIGENGGGCMYHESTAPRDRGAVTHMPANDFPDVKSVIDFGGGVGAYLTVLGCLESQSNNSRT